VGKAATRHGMHKTAEYRAWGSIRQRCGNPKNTQFKDYGGRGIRVCQEWLDSFDTFYAYIGPKPSPQHTIDRIDINGHYEPGNVRWATKKEQERNKRNSRFVEYEGQTKTIAEWAESSSVTRDVLWHRIKLGWSMDDALTATKYRREQ